MEITKFQRDKIVKIAAEKQGIEYYTPLPPSPPPPLHLTNTYQLVSFEILVPLNRICHQAEISRTFQLMFTFTMKKVVLDRNYT